MCLYKRDIKHSYKCETINGEKLIPVWKVITGTNESPLFIILKGRSMANLHYWRKGWNMSTHHKNNYDKYDYDFGFHFLLTKNEAQEYVKYVKEQWGRDVLSSLKIVKMYVRQQDILARGFAGDNIRALTASRAYWKG